MCMGFLEESKKWRRASPSFSFSTSTCSSFSSSPSPPSLVIAPMTEGLYNSFLFLIRLSHECFHWHFPTKVSPNVPHLCPICICICISYFSSVCFMNASISSKVCPNVPHLVSLLLIRVLGTLDGCLLPRDMQCLHSLHLPGEDNWDLNIEQ